MAAPDPGWTLIEQGWSAVDALIGDTLIGEDPVLASCAARSRDAGLPDIAVPPALGKFLALLASISGARRILEIGTLGGYSTIWLARAVGADGRVVTLELSQHNAEVARRNLDEAGLSNRVEIIVGSARETLCGLSGPFDMVFIDADKQSNLVYVDHAIRLVSAGGLIVVDNMVREGRILDPAPDDEATRATRALYDHVGVDPRLEATVLQTVGGKGWDGMLIARVVA